MHRVSLTTVRDKCSCSLKKQVQVWSLLWKTFHGIVFALLNIRFHRRVRLDSTESLKHPHWLRKVRYSSLSKQKISSPACEIPNILRFSTQEIIRLLNNTFIVPHKPSIPFCERQNNTVLSRDILMNCFYTDPYLEAVKFNFWNGLHRLLSLPTVLYTGIPYHSI